MATETFENEAADGVALNAPSALAIAAGSDSGFLGDHITNDTTPTVTGHADANATVTLYDGATTLGATTADGSGNWSVTSPTLTEGDHILTAIATDGGGDTSAASSGFAISIDTIGPTGIGLSTTTVSAVTATSGSTLATLSATDAHDVRYGLQVGDTVMDADNSKVTISGTSLVVGASSLTPGSYHFYLHATDTAGNESFQTFTLNVVDAPAITAITRVGGASATAPAAGSSVSYTVSFDRPVTGVDASDFILTPTNTAAGTIASVTGNGATYTVTVNGLSGDGTLRLDLKSSGSGIESGSSVGIIGGYTLGQTYTLDHTAPDAPSVPSMSSASDTGTSNSDHITSNATQTFTGSAEANATIKLYDTGGTTVLGATTADGSGNWSITSSTLGEGDHTLTAKATDAAGNVSSASSGLAVTIDTTAPTAHISVASTVLHPGETAEVTITFDEPVSGLGADDLTVDHGALSNLSSADGGTTWTATLTPVTNQAAAINHIVLDNTGVQDLAGNAGAGTTSSTSYAIDPNPISGGGTPPTPVLVVTTPNGNEVTGNDDNNLIASSGGADTVSAGAGDDTVAAGSHNDILQGNVGKDSISAGAGDDVVHGGQGDDLVQGNTGADLLFGDKGGDTVLGGQGDDIIQGGQGDDYVSGDIGHDVVLGGQGDDRLFGGLGDDDLSGDLGNDTLTGGAGADTFHSFAGAGVDLVTDFNRAEGDRVMLAPGTSYTVSQVGADVHIDIGGGGELILAHVQLSSLAGAWIVA